MKVGESPRPPLSFQYLDSLVLFVETRITVNPIKSLWDSGKGNGEVKVSKGTTLYFIFTYKTIYLVGNLHLSVTNNFLYRVCQLLFRCLSFRDRPSNPSDPFFPFLLIGWMRRTERGNDPFGRRWVLVEKTGEGPTCHNNTVTLKRHRSILIPLHEVVRFFQCLF